MRAVCAGKKVFFGQFIKGMDYSELKAVDYLVLSISAEYNIKNWTKIYLRIIIILSHN